jgi:predicted alpha/beta-hydrolase family hydrolase
VTARPSRRATPGGSGAGEPFERAAGAGPAVRGVLHRGAGPDALVLAHGAGGNCDAPWLVALAAAFAARGVTALRCDLPYRQARATGPPSPAGAARDRDGLRAAVAAIRDLASGRVFLGGHSYGGRQASLLAAEEVTIADALLLSSYPLHPPHRPASPRTAHLAALRVPVFFVHGTRDAFGSPDELRSALALVPAPTHLFTVEGGAHGLIGRADTAPALAERVAAAFVDWAGRAGTRAG